MFWMEMVEITCEVCGDPFTRRKAEVDRSSRLGRKNFCDLSCANGFNSKEFPRPETYKNLCPRVPDGLEPFRWFMRVCLRRSVKKTETIDIDAQFLKELWELQSGICPFSGIYMVLPTSTKGWESPGFNSASLDRIDNRFGYLKGNVRFVTRMANLARSVYDDSILIDFCRSVARRHS